MYIMTDNNAVFSVITINCYNSKSQVIIIDDHNQYFM